MDTTAAGVDSALGGAESAAVLSDAGAAGAAAAAEPGELLCGMRQRASAPASAGTIVLAQTLHGCASVANALPGSVCIAHPCVSQQPQNTSTGCMVEALRSAGVQGPVVLYEMGTVLPPLLNDTLMQVSAQRQPFLLVGERLQVDSALASEAVGRVQTTDLPERVWLRARHTLDLGYIGLHVSRPGKMPPLPPRLIGGWHWVYQHLGSAQPHLVVDGGFALAVASRQPDAEATSKLPPLAPPQSRMLLPHELPTDDRAPTSDAQHFYHKLWSRADAQRNVALLYYTVGYEKLMQNWICWCERIGFRHYLIVVNDAERYAALTAAGIPAIHDAVWSRSLPHNAAKTSADYGTVDFQRIMTRRTLFLERVLLAGFHLLSADLDSVWLQDPFPHMDPQCDLSGQAHNVGASGAMPAAEFGLAGGIAEADSETGWSPRAAVHQRYRRGDGGKAPAAPLPAASAALPGRARLLRAAPAAERQLLSGGDPQQLDRRYRRQRGALPKARPVVGAVRPARWLHARQRAPGTHAHRLPRATASAGAGAVRLAPGRTGASVAGVAKSGAGSRRPPGCGDLGGLSARQRRQPASARAGGTIRVATRPAAQNIPHHSSGSAGPVAAAVRRRKRWTPADGAGRRRRPVADVLPVGEGGGATVLSERHRFRPAAIWRHAATTARGDSVTTPHQKRHTVRPAAGRTFRPAPLPVSAVVYLGAGILPAPLARVLVVARGEAPRSGLCTLRAGSGNQLVVSAQHGRHRLVALLCAIRLRPRAVRLYFNLNRFHAKPEQALSLAVNTRPDGLNYHGWKGPIGDLITFGPERVDWPDVSHIPTYDFASDRWQAHPHALALLPRLYTRFPPDACYPQSRVEFMKAAAAAVASNQRNQSTGAVGDASDAQRRLHQRQGNGAGSTVRARSHNTSASS
eukprot:ctg_1066.g218